ncbi:MAG: cellulase family glycosylhydrolase [Phycisphaerae bacterium]|nr:cellulase family glycosylhydrolase [Phycisphaerae bacterium]
MAHFSDTILADAPKEPDQWILPRWRGFNLQYFFSSQSDCRPIENDFRWMADWGFNFARLPMSYRHWCQKDDVYAIKESMLEEIDKAVQWAQKYKIHLSLNFHRGPGYSINRELQEPYNLWKSEKALKAFCFHWELFAKRYNGISPKALSFDLINEPPNPNGLMSQGDYERVVRATVKTIRKVDPNRQIIINGLFWGNAPLEELADLNIGQSCRGYQPFQLTHYKASWVQSKNFPVPVWPDSKWSGHRWNRKRLEYHYKPWVKLARKGVGVHCGECGCYKYTSHKVALDWLTDLMGVLKGHSIGYALWNLKGSFGILDSNRKDVDYKEFHGHKLDKKMLDILLRH